MELNEYQKKAMETCMDTFDNFSYMMLNLVGEVGELAGKMAKKMRKGQIKFLPSGAYHYNGYAYPEEVNVPETISAEHKELKMEAGDILWQLSGLCKIMGWTLEEVAQGNLDKLASRKQRGVIDGNGDNR